MFNKIKLAGLFCPEFSQAALVRARMNRGSGDIVRIHVGAGGNRDDINGVLPYALNDQCSIYMVFGKSKCAMAHDINEIGLTHHEIFLIYPDYIANMNKSVDDMYRFFYLAICNISGYLYQQRAIISSDIVDLNMRGCCDDREKLYALYSLYKTNGSHSAVLDDCKATKEVGNKDEVLEKIKHLDELRDENVRAEERARTTSI